MIGGPSPEKKAGEERVMKSSRSDWEALFVRLSVSARGLLLVSSLVLMGACAQKGEPKSEPVDFDASLKGLNFDVMALDANLNGGKSGDGMLDADQLALAAYVLNHPDKDLSTGGGVSPLAVRDAYGQALASAKSDLSFLNVAYPTGADVVAGYALLGPESLEAMAAMTAAFGAPLKKDYAAATSMGRYFSADGDADGDGVSNGDEYRATIAGGRHAFIAAALDPQATQGVPAPASADAPTAVQGMTVGIALYPGFELLDVFGPAEMWANVPEMQVTLVAETAGPVASAQQGISADAALSFADAPQFDILMVPGGVGTYQQLGNPVFLEFLKTQDERTEYTTSVCTGSALLAKAGLLSGRKATSNKAFFSLATEQDSSVDWQKSARWVEDGKYFTSSGVSAGTDMALGLVAKIRGEADAVNLARSLEYVWNPNPDDDPFELE